MANWIWYPGDFEIYHGMCQNFEREERGFFWPAYWHVDDCYRSVVFSKEYFLEKETEFQVYLKGSGHVEIKYWNRQGEEQQRKYVPENKILCPRGKVVVKVIVYSSSGLPCAYVEGKKIYSDTSWLADHYTGEKKLAGCSDLFTAADQNPMEFPYTSRIVSPVDIEEIQEGILYDFGEEITAETILHLQEDIGYMQICYGESREEALDTERCYLKHILKKGENDERFGCYEGDTRYRTRLRAFRYIFIPEKEAAKRIKLEADYKFVDFPERSSFSCSDALINQIWQVSERTFRLSSGIFFIDGIKRDRWIWSGDAYQSYYINQYLSADREISKRTILALRGKDPIRQHLNTIVDYSMYWIMSIGDYYTMTGDQAFIEQIYPKTESLMRYCMEQLDEQGFIYGRKGDWIYIDWAEFDKEGTFCAEQMLLARCYETMIQLRNLLGMETAEYEALFRNLKTRIKQYFWDAEKGAYIDSYQSGRRNVTRHANIFAILFGYADENEKESILHQVLLNEQVPAITTPYFKYYELECLAVLGRMDMVMETIRSYWGGMLEKGATTFWEEYKPDDPQEQQYDMYGDKYGKSLCHAWGASPVYLIGRYCMGIRPTAPGYASFEAVPRVDLFKDFCCYFPVNEGTIRMSCRDGILEIETDQPGGMVVLGDQKYELKKNKILKLYV